MQEFHSNFCYRLILWSPLAAPYFWLTINASIILYSLFLLYLLVNSKVDHFSIENYLAYNVITCLIWIIEVSLVILTYVRLASVIEWKHRWSHLVEAILAAYFLIFSIYDIFQTHRGADYSERMMIIDLLINLLAYIYMCEVYMRQKESDEVGNNSKIIDHVQSILNAEQVTTVKYQTFEDENPVV